MSLTGAAAPEYSKGTLVDERGGAEVRLGELVVGISYVGSSMLGFGGGDEEGASEIESAIELVEDGATEVLSGGSLKEGEEVEGTGVSLLGEGVSLLGPGV